MSDGMVPSTNNQTSSAPSSYISERAPVADVPPISIPPAQSQDPYAAQHAQLATVNGGEGGPSQSHGRKRKTNYNKQRHREYSRIWRRRKKEEAETLKKAALELSIYRTLAEESPGMISIHSANPKAIFLYASRAFCRQLGVEPSKLLGVSLIELAVETDTTSLRDICNSLASKDLAAAKDRCKTKEDGDSQICRFRLNSQGKVFSLESTFRLGQQGIVMCSKLRAIMQA